MALITSLTDAERSAVIAARKKESPFWRWVDRGASLHLAMVLLLTLALACAVATVAESKFNADVARHYIYRAPWFLFWLMLLATNLICVILSRWPWQKKHLSFVVAHIGIITLLTGAVIGQKAGFEGFMNLEIGQPPQHRVVVNQTIVSVRLPGGTSSYQTAFPVEVRPPTEAHPRFLALPQGRYRLKIDGYSETVGTQDHLVPSTDAEAGPGVALKLTSPAQTQTLTVVLLQNDPDHRVADFFGLASLEWGDALSTSAPDSLPTLRVSMGPKGEVFYQLLRQGKPYAHGNLHQGEPLPLGWGDWRATLLDSSPKAGVETEVIEAKDVPDAAPGIRASLLDHDTVVGGPLWIPSGRSQAFQAPDGAAFQVAFGLKTIPLPFQVSLLDFRVPRDEGTETPADFIATLHFDDGAGRVRDGEAHMNYPASFPGGFWGSVFGRNYKFSQSSWNPGNLRQSTVQILFDPGWPLKWTGSILIVIGVGLLFYYKPRTRRPDLP